MCDFFALNMVGPSFLTVKRENKKSVHFVSGEHIKNFRCITKIYKNTDITHGIVGLVPMILVEGKTKVKARICKEPKYGTLAGFCGVKENHVCLSHFKPVLGIGDKGYASLVDAFRNNPMGGFNRVIMVNPLHENCLL
jgi:hypothetical protein